MRKHVADTDLYIDFIRAGSHHGFLKDLYARETPGLYFSSVVIEELLAGAIHPKGRERVEILFRPFEKAGRILTPSHSTWKEAGDFLAWARTAHPHARSKLPLLTNDALIAFSARSIGATVHTSNRADFELMARWRPFHLNVVE